MTTTIKVNGTDLRVTINLEAALRRLGTDRESFMGTDQEFFIWADALCINQTDNQEKGLQVPKMRTIFKKASEVAVWLGKEHDIDETSIKCLYTETAPGIDRDTCLSTFPIFTRLLGRPYWRRVWIIQELAVAAHIRLYCGRYPIPWQAIDSNCNCCQNGHPADENVSRFIMLRDIRADWLNRRPIYLLDALHRTRSSSATDERDKIFALLGLAWDREYFIPAPSYMGTFSDTFTDFATSLLKSNEPLDFIYLRIANREVDGLLPSWVPDWTDLDDPVAHRQFDYIMLHVSHKSRRAYDGAEITFSGPELNAKCVLFDTVDGLGTALTSDGDASAHETATPDEPAYPYKSQDEISHIVYQTLASTEMFPASQCKTLDSMPSDLYRIWRIGSVQLEEMMPTTASHNLSNSICTWLAENRSFKVHGQTIEYWTKTWSKLPNETDSVQNEHRFFNTIRSRMRLLMTKSGHLGWAHPQTRKGDKIAVLFGCSRPVILRAYQAGYRIAGDACLSGQSIRDLREMAIDEEVENVRIL
ncbi:Heterokaryon incompatibility protein 6, OR allele [Fusarium oxysporum f. sp. raphani]|nr:Heterokaryon incompatibility protein 6, OR allele [Fusarium oxysporum f. sp. raphani]